MKTIKDFDVKKFRNYIYFHILSNKNETSCQWQKVSRKRGYLFNQFHQRVFNRSLHCKSPVGFLLSFG